MVRTKKTDVSVESVKVTEVPSENLDHGNLRTCVCKDCKLGRLEEEVLGLGVASTCARQEINGLEIRLQAVESDYSNLKARFSREQRLSVMAQEGHTKQISSLENARLDGVVQQNTLDTQTERRLRSLEQSERRLQTLEETARRQTLRLRLLEKTSNGVTIPADEPSSPTLENQQAAIRSQLHKVEVLLQSVSRKMESLT